MNLDTDSALDALVTLRGLLPDLSTLGSVSSLIGLILTLVIARRVRDIRHSFMLKARLPEAIKRINKELNTMSIMMRDFGESPMEFAACVRAAGAEIKLTARKLPRGDSRDTAERVAKRADRASTDIQKAAAGELYVDLRGVLAELRHHQSDLRWSSNG